MSKGSEAQKQRPPKLLWMLWFDEKSMSVSTMCVSCKQAENNINVSIELDGILCTSIPGSIKKKNKL